MIATGAVAEQGLFLGLNFVGWVREIKGIKNISTYFLYYLNFLVCAMPSYLT